MAFLFRNADYTFAKCKYCGWNIFRRRGAANYSWFHNTSLTTACSPALLGCNNKFAEPSRGEDDELVPMVCEVCGKPSGRYTRCRGCFQAAYPAPKQEAAKQEEPKQEEVPIRKFKWSQL